MPSPVTRSTTRSITQSTSQSTRPSVAQSIANSIASIHSAWSPITRLLDSLQPMAALLARLYITYVFFLSGLTKLRDWGTTKLCSPTSTKSLFVASSRCDVEYSGRIGIAGAAGAGPGGPLFSTGFVCCQRGCGDLVE